MTKLSLTFASAVAASLIEVGVDLPGRDEVVAIDGVLPTAEELEIALTRAGRDNAPRLLAALAARGFVDATNGVIVGSVWSDAEHPERNLVRSTWRELFAISGYTDDFRVTSPPREPLRLYRGAVEDHRDGWSWTDDLDVARHYANGHYGRSPGRVWTALVEPERLLCRNTFRDESEYVVDTTGLAISQTAE